VGESRVRTIIDVVEDAVGSMGQVRAEALSGSALDRLAHSIIEFYDSWTPLGAEDGRMYSGGWIAGNFEAPESRRYLFSSLLYYPEVVIHEPLADWFFPYREQLWAPPGIWADRRSMRIDSAEPAMLANSGYFRFISELDRTRSFLASVLPALAELAPLIRSGAVVPVPQWWIVHKHQPSIETAIRYDVRDTEFAKAVSEPVDVPLPRSDQVRGMAITPGGGWSPGEAQRALTQDPSYFLNKTLLIQEQSGALYVPPYASDAALFEVRLRRVGEELASKGVEFSVAPSLVSAELPFIEDVNVPTLLKIRRDEEHFEDWRRTLRTVVRQVRLLPADGDEFRREAKEVLEDALLPQVAAIQRRTKVSSVLRGSATDRAADLAVSAATLGLMTATGEPFTVTAAASLGVSAVGRWAISPLLSSRADRHSVLATLVRRSSPKR
jgi:hypothetical protein